VQESTHIFIEAGFMHAVEMRAPGNESGISQLRILEIGFGTGLNALLTLAEAEKLNIMVHYSAIEAFPLEEECWRALNYPHRFGSVDLAQVFPRLHLATWGEATAISARFTLQKIKVTLEEYIPPWDAYDLVYFDAFAPDAQPHLWTAEIFRKLSQGMKHGGILVTFSVKGSVVRALQHAGFVTEKIPGPPGKRHILRADKK